MNQQLAPGVRELRLSLRNGGLVLEGLTHTYYVKQLAQHALMECLDMPIQANDIQVV